MVLPFESFRSGALPASYFCTVPPCGVVVALLSTFLGGFLAGAFFGAAFFGSAFFGSVVLGGGALVWSVVASAYGVIFGSVVVVPWAIAFSAKHARAAASVTVVLDGFIAPLYRYSIRRRRSCLPRDFRRRARKLSDSTMSEKARAL